MLRVFPCYDLSLSVSGISMNLSIILSLVNRELQPEISPLLLRQVVIISRSYSGDPKSRNATEFKQTPSTRCPRFGRISILTLFVTAWISFSRAFKSRICVSFHFLSALSNLGIFRTTFFSKIQLGWVTVLSNFDPPGGNTWLGGSAN